MSRNEFPNDLTEWTEDEIRDAFDEEPREFLDILVDQVIYTKDVHDGKAPLPSISRDPKYIALQNREEAGERVHPSEYRDLLVQRAKQRRHLYGIGKEFKKTIDSDDPVY